MKNSYHLKNECSKSGTTEESLANADKIGFKNESCSNKSSQ